MAISKSDLRLLKEFNKGRYSKIDKHKDKRRVRNTTKDKSKLIYDNIQFRSGLEAYCYKSLKNAHLSFEYEAITYPLVQSFVFNGRCVESKKKGYFLDVDKKQSKVKPWTYKPDFTNIKDKWVIECKGFKGEDTWRLKLKMFKLLMKDEGLTIYVPSNHKQIDETIKMILNDKDN